MNKNSKIIMPSKYTVLDYDEKADISGGGSLLNFIAYLLGGLDISFGNGQSQINTDTTTKASYAQTGTSTGKGGSVWGTASHSNETTVSQHEYSNVDVHYNLGSMFKALVRLFL